MSSNRLNILVAESEPADARAKRRDSVGRSSGETYQAVLDHLVPDARVTRIMPVDADARLPHRAELADYDAVILTGSPLHLYKESAETRRVVEFMRAVFASGTPSFGSCAGLQVATVAAGGSVRPMADRREAGFARRIMPSGAGRSHPLLRSRPQAYDAPAIHTDEVEALPAGATLLACNATTQVQAAEIRLGDGTFWGVQYHPEISLAEVAAALRRDTDDLVEHGLAADGNMVERHAGMIDALHADPARRDLRWLLAIDDEVTDPHRRTTEVRNFVEQLVRPIRARRGKG